MAGQRVVVSVLADTKAFHRSMNRLGDVTGFSKLRTGIKNVAVGMAKLVTAAGAAAVALGTVAVNAAKDLEQSIGGVDAVFKDSADQMHKYAEAADEALGLSSNSYNELATTLGALLKNGGTPLDELGGKTNDLITLGSDMAAMFGGSTTDAVNALSSALKGERDPIEKYGVSLRQSSIDAKAAEMGFEKVGGALSAEATQAATLALIMEQTSDAHGAFGRESGTLSNKLERTKAKLENMAATIGTYLIPVVGAVVDWVAARLTPAMEGLQRWIESTGIPAFRRFSDVWKVQILPALKNASTWIQTNVLPVLQRTGQWIIGTLIPALSDGVRWIVRNRDVIIPLVAAVTAGVAAWKTYQRTLLIVRAAKNAVAAAQLALNVAMRANPIGLIITAIIGLIAGLVTLYKSNESFRDLVQRVWEAIKSAIGGVVSWITDTALPAIKGFIDAVIEGWNSVRDWTVNAWDTVKTTISTTWETIKTTISGAIAAVTGTVSTGWTSVKDWTTSAWDTARTTVYNAWEQIKTSILNAIGSIKGTMTALPGNISSWIGSLGSTLWAKGRDLITGLGDGIGNKIVYLSALISYLPSRIVRWIGNLGSTLWQAGRSLIQGLVNGIGSMFSAVQSKLTELTVSMPAWKGPPDRDKTLLTGAGQLIMQGLINGLESKYAAVRRSLRTFTGTLSGSVNTDLTAGLTARLNPALISQGMAAPVTVNVELHTLRPDVDTARAVAQALEDYERMTGRKR